MFTKTGAVVAASIGAMPLVVKAARTALEETGGELGIVDHGLSGGPVERGVADVVMEHVFAVR